MDENYQMCCMCIDSKNVFDMKEHIIYIILKMFIGICMCSQQITLVIQCLKVHACHPLICGCKQRPGSTMTVLLLFGVMKAQMQPF